MMATTAYDSFWSLREYRDASEDKKLIVSFTMPCADPDPDTASSTSSPIRENSINTIAEHAPVEKPTTRPFTCAACGKGFTFKARLIQHAMTHVAANPFACDVCAKVY